MPRLRIGSLFTGYGGLDMAVEDVFNARTAWVSEIDPGACKVLAHRFPHAPNLGDITAINWADVEPVDIIAGGSPCQDLSTAGRRAGMTDGTRSNLWVQMREAIAAIQPRYVIWENVRGAYSAAAASAMESDEGLLGDHPAGQPALRALGRVLGDLAELGYDAQWRGLRAADVGACHGRFRVFVLAERRDAAAGNAANQHLPRAVGGRDSGRRPEDAPGDTDRDTRPARHGLAAPTLLPTPRASDGTHGGPNQRGSKGDLMLPTPSASVANDGEGTDTWLARRERVKLTANNGNGMGMPLTIAVQLLPTPLVGSNSPAAHGQISGQFRRQMDEALAQFGQYAPAIARQEQAFGYPAPSPTEPGRNNRPRLSARFASWMMGAPPGWITDVPGVTRNEALRMAGNGVVRQQAFAALIDMRQFVPW